MTIDHPTLGLVTISPMQPDEFAYIADSWMRSSEWRRSAIVAVIEAGGVLVARDDAGLALGWLALDDGHVAHGSVKSGYRGNGMMRILWEAAGKPATVADGAMKRARKVLDRLKEGT